MSVFTPRDDCQRIKAIPIFKLSLSLPSPSPPFLSLFPSSSSLSFSTGLHRMEQEWEEKGRQKSMNWRLVEFLYLLFIWDHILVQPSHQDPAATNQHVSKEFDWLISDRGPFHHSRSYLSFVERHRQGFTTRYKIYRYVGFLQHPSLWGVVRWWACSQLPWDQGLLSMEGCITVPIPPGSAS